MRRLLLIMILGLSLSYSSSAQCDPLCPPDLNGGGGFSCTAFGMGAGICQATIGSTTITCIYIDDACSASVVPVEFGNFEGRLNNKSVSLSWSTVSEVNNNIFEIERSYDGIDFMYIDQKKGAGNSSEELIYSYLDSGFDAREQVLYYRLKQIDFDGNFTYGKIITVRNEGDATVISDFYYDNVALTLEIDATDDTTSEISLVDMQGKIYYNASHFFSEGKNNLNIIKSNLSGGLYVVSIITTNNQVITRKILLY